MYGALIPISSTEKYVQKPLVQPTTVSCDLALSFSPPFSCKAACHDQGSQRRYPPHPSPLFVDYYLGVAGTDVPGAASSHPDIACCAVCHISLFNLGTELDQQCWKALPLCVEAALDSDRYVGVV